MEHLFYQTIYLILKRKASAAKSRSSFPQFYQSCHDLNLRPRILSYELAFLQVLNWHLPPSLSRVHPRFVILSKNFYLLPSTDQQAREFWRCSKRRRKMQSFAAVFFSAGPDEIAASSIAICSVALIRFLPIGKPGPKIGRA